MIEAHRRGTRIYMGERAQRTVIAIGATVTAVVMTAHLGLMVARCLPGSGIWREANRALAYLPSRLRLYGPWDMFAMRKKRSGSGSSYVAAQVELRDGGVFNLVGPRPEGKTLRDELRDRRLRKIIRRLGKPHTYRVFGRTTLDYLCREALAQGTPAKRVTLYKVHSAPGPTGVEEVRRKSLGSQSCDQAAAHRPAGGVESPKNRPESRS
ncbi:MAG: hypothetical protein B7733_06805 [Myxococcales bacterium FL481]|nr:MAG: hypothetical protein B7733_06805 [Myxococcales bacterium FL481]